MNEATVPIETRGEPGPALLRARTPDPCTVVIFGATGDLAHRKLIPALYNLTKSNSLPEAFAIIGIGRSAPSAEAFRSGLRESTGRFSRTQPLDPQVWDRFSPRIDYLAGSLEDGRTYAALTESVAEVEKRDRTQGNRLYYLATPPAAFPVILRQLSQAGLLYPASGSGEGPWSRVIIEKPFGRDLTSARELNRLAAEVLEESQIYRIDHYLGKETVQNILVFRFGNSIFEPVWNRKYVDHVQITAAEEIGVEGRGRFYDETGVVRDIVQNHLLQVLALCAMEPPVSFGADDVREEKVQVLRSLRPISGGEAAERVVAGQYRGYREEPGVARDSRTPTYVALKVLIDNWRWQGVPFYLRAGKRLASRLTEVSVHFQPIPFCLFGTEEVCQRIEPNVLTLGIQPDEGIALRFASKVPGEDIAVGTVTMDFCYSRAFNRPSPEAYERLILDSMRGDATLFARRDEVERAWEFVTPILDAWKSELQQPLPLYEPGSAGPKEADSWIRRERHRWRKLR